MRIVFHKPDGNRIFKHFTHDINECEEITLPSPCYEYVRPDHCQKPYFIWEGNDYIIPMLISSIKKVMSEWYSIDLHDTDICIVSYQDMYHLIVDNYYHPNGAEAQLFHDEVIAQLDPSLYFLFMGTRRRDKDRYLLCSDPTIIQSIDHCSPLITYIRGKILVKNESSLYYTVVSYIYYWLGW